MLDYGNPVRPPSNGIRYGSADLTTPIVEIEEPLLMAPEALELVQQSKFSIDMEGLSLVLFTEEDPLAVNIRLISIHCNLNITRSFIARIYNMLCSHCLKFLCIRPLL